MARTKQSARKSTGGKAPRRQLCVKSTSQFRNYFTSQQSSGDSSTRTKAIFVNYENTLREFKFSKESGKGNEFEPIVKLGHVSKFSENENDASASDLYMRLDFVSCLDGGGIKEIGRPPLDVCIVLDISGSMGGRFPEDSDNRSKLAVAVACIKNILEQLHDSDRVSIVLFDTQQETLAQLQCATFTAKDQLSSSLNSVVPRGGTNLAEGLRYGIKMLEKPSVGSRACASLTGNAADDDVEGTDRMKRVIFMTDMISTPQDEEYVLSLGQTAADRDDDPIHLTVVGMGVDLSVRTVTAMSAMRGAKYISVTNAEEFSSSVGSEFAYDVTPIAFDIEIALPPTLLYEKAYGTSELNTLPPGSQVAKISSEFPNPVDEMGEVAGAFILFKLKEVEGVQISGSADITISWTSRSGQRQQMSVSPNRLPTQTAATRKRKLHSSAVAARNTRSSGEVDLGLRKAVALVSYVDALTAYLHVQDRGDGEGSTDPTTRATPTVRGCDRGRQYGGVRKARVKKMTEMDQEAEQAMEQVIEKCPDEVIASLQKLQVGGLLRLPNLDTLPQPLPPHLVRSHGYIHQFKRLKEHLFSECMACGDDSLTGTNQNIIQTIDQIIKLETSEIEKIFLALARENVGRMTGGMERIPKGLLCPISLQLMQDPVMAADGHSYERHAIEQWLQTSNTSPITNLPLSHSILTDNHALRSAIEEFAQSPALSDALRGVVGAEDEVDEEQPIVGRRTRRSKRRIS